MVPVKAGISTAPDWPLEILFVLGGFAGMYWGARLQGFVPQRLIKAMLDLIMLFFKSSYIAGSIPSDWRSLFDLVLVLH